MTRFDHPDGHAAARDRQLDTYHRIKHAIVETIRAKGRPVRASEVAGASPVQVGKCVDKYPNTFRRFSGTGKNGKNDLACIGFHRDLAKWEPHYEEHAHLLAEL